ncbi:MAG: ABC transporter ATP-binding protein [Phycisphaerales bacterium]|nr:ABC transporter ATP-binding protein [Phycisphaerales bacterium]
MTNPPPFSSAIQCTAVTKSYKQTHVLRGLDLSIPSGSVVGLLGKNAAGKTTLLKAILGLIRPNEGFITTLGHDAWDLPPEVKARIGYVPQLINLYPWMKVRHIIDYTASFYPRWDRALINRLIGEWELPESAVIGPLSAGQLQKLAILLAIGHQPDLLVLDEPAAALDPSARRAFLAMLLEIVGDAGGSRTILFSTHITADLERIADRVVMLKDGQAVYHDSLDSLKDNVKRLRITAAATLPSSLNISNTLSEQIVGTNARITVSHLSPDLLTRLAADLHATIEVDDLNLDEIFLEFHHA